MSTPIHHLHLARLCRLVLSLALALSLLSTVAPVGAQPQTDRVKAQEIFKRGQGFFVEGRYNEAAVEFLNAFQLDPHPAIMYNVARAHEEMGKLVKALQYYRVALSLKPSKAVKEELERKIAELELTLRADGVDVLNLDSANWVPKGKISIQTSPPGAEITINGQSAGRSPIDERVLPQGEYRIRISKPGFQPEERVLEVVGGKTYIIKPELFPGDESGPVRRADMGMVDVVVDRRNLMVFIDGEPVASTPVGRIEVTPGRHTVSVEGDGFPTYEETFEVAAGQVARVVARRPQIIIKKEEPGVLLTREQWGWVTVGTGGVVMGVGAIFGAVALGNASDYESQRSAPNRADLRDSAITNGVLADVSYGVGAALIVTGALIIALDTETPLEEEEQRPAYMDDLVWHISPQILPGGAGVSADVSW